MYCAVWEAATLFLPHWQCVSRCGPGDPVCVGQMTLFQIPQLQMRVLFWAPSRALVAGVRCDGQHGGGGAVLHACMAVLTAQEPLLRFTIHKVLWDALCM